MTTREFYLSIINGNGTDSEIVAKATELLAKHDASNEKRKSADSKEKVATRERLETVRKALCSIPMTADAIAEECNVTVGQARSALSALVKEGFATKVETKIDKSRKMVYSLAE